MCSDQLSSSSPLNCPVMYHKNPLTGTHTHTPALRQVTLPLLQGVLQPPKDTISPYRRATLLGTKGHPGIILNLWSSGCPGCFQMCRESIKKVLCPCMWLYLSHHPLHTDPRVLGYWSQMQAASQCTKEPVIPLLITAKPYTTRNGTHAHLCLHTAPQQNTEGSLVRVRACKVLAYSLRF